MACTPEEGVAKFCEASYDKADWWRISSIDVDDQGHILYSTNKLNTFYEASELERGGVQIQEGTHGIAGLGHSTTSENGGFAMDYFDDGTLQSNRLNGKDYAGIAINDHHVDVPQKTESIHR